MMELAPLNTSVLRAYSIEFYLINVMSLCVFKTLFLTIPQTLRGTCELLENCGYVFFLAVSCHERNGIVFMRSYTRRHSRWRKDEQFHQSLSPALNLTLPQSLFHFLLLMSLFVNHVILYPPPPPPPPSCSLSISVFLSVFLLVCISALLVIVGA